MPISVPAKRTELDPFAAYASRRDTADRAGRTTPMRAAIQNRQTDQHDQRSSTPEEQEARGVLANAEVRRRHLKATIAAKSAEVRPVGMAVVLDG